MSISKEIEKNVWTNTGPFEMYKEVGDYGLLVCEGMITSFYWRISTGGMIGIVKQGDATPKFSEKITYKNWYEAAKIVQEETDEALKTFLKKQISSTSIHLALLG